MGHTEAFKDFNGEDWMSLADAAQELGETRQTVLTRAVKGEVDAKHVAGRTIVSRSSVERVKQQRESAAAR